MGGHQGRRGEPGNVVSGKPREEGASEGRKWAAVRNTAGGTSKTRTETQHCTQQHEHHWGPQMTDLGISGERGKSLITWVLKENGGERLQTAWRNNPWRTFAVKGRGK